ncbi:trafficking protein particle complex subunit 2-like protein isoform X2 [Juglans microcarpa x Juglans regia]|uniref:trafficking protein particle complex subunit 2-like protein isoform X2 n=1 Tax=Juglans microcarpa x Juglans regia TaxID=2249226 RepID=UPI001B7F61BD|nr:trafficking protein particle complex subunit 2-like protein isoform X2 [Juglans microcarpa x Juglans regia]
MIVCVAVVGHQNNPLYIQSFTEADDALKLHHIVHCSLDVIGERVNNPKKSGPTLNETFLGLLYPTENYKVYGYLTNTKVKFIVVTTDLDVRDADVRNVIYGIQKELVQLQQDLKNIIADLNRPTPIFCCHFQLL